MADERSRLFKKNLRELMERLELRPKEVADACKFDEAGYKWLRRIHSAGLSRRQGNNREYLEQIARVLLARMKVHFLDYPRIETWKPADVVRLLWAPSLVDALAVESKKRPPADTEETCRQLRVLLESAQFPYLQGLIEDLYQRHTLLLAGDG